VPTLLGGSEIAPPAPPGPSTTASSAVMRHRSLSPTSRIEGTLIRSDLSDLTPSDLTNLALRSKAYWGYDATFIESCRTELTLGAEAFERLHVAVAERAGHLAGFYALSGDAPDAELSFLFVEPEFIGTGVGTALLGHCRAVAAEFGFERIWIASDPFAERFYLAMGAVRVGATPSESIPGRSLPVLWLDVPPRR
jgi:GNAT superfamily N-acetyltransferase